MLRLASCLALLTLAATTPAPADSLKDALALEKTLQDAIQNAEPSIACILVSRSDTYAKYRTTPAATDLPGKLGDFDLDTIRRHYPLTETDYRNLLKYDMRPAEYVPETYGSGIVIDESGLILTNYHVIKDATKVFVRLPGDKSGYADIHAADPRSDLAVLRLLKAPAGLKAIKVGDGGKAKKGQMVLSIANPFAAGFVDGSPSASWGIIGNLRRRAPSGPDVSNEAERKKTLHHYGTLIQTDARLNLGCSGGALIDLKGELIGLTTSLAAISGSETAGGFAVPMDAGMRRVIDVLKRGEEVEYGFLGVQLDPRAAGGEGVRVDQVATWSPAYRGGVRDRDVILTVNGTPVRDNDDLFLAVGTLLAGAEAKLEIRRDNEPKTLTVALAKFYVPGPVIASRKPIPVRGLRVDHVSVLLQAMRTFPQPPATVPNGVVIREILPGSAAANANLKVNDVITHINGKAVTSPREFYDAAQNVKGALELTLDPTRQVKLN